LFLWNGSKEASVRERQLRSRAASLEQRTDERKPAVEELFAHPTFEMAKV